MTHVFLNLVNLMMKTMQKRRGREENPTHLKFIYLNQGEKSFFHSSFLFFTTNLRFIFNLF